jgi:chromosome segregation ATPase
MRRFLIGMLAYLTLSFPIDRNGKLYFFLRLILLPGRKAVYFFKTAIDKMGNLKTRASKNKYEREFIMNSIGELKESSMELSNAVNSLSADVAEIAKMHGEILSELRRINRESDEFLDKIKKETQIDSLRYDALVDSLRTSNDRLTESLENLQKEIK